MASTCGMYYDTAPKTHHGLNFPTISIRPKRRIRLERFASATGSIIKASEFEAVRGRLCIIRIVYVQ